MDHRSPEKREALETGKLAIVFTFAELAVSVSSCLSTFKSHKLNGIVEMFET